MSDPDPRDEEAPTATDEERTADGERGASDGERTASDGERSADGDRIRTDGASPGSEDPIRTDGAPGSAEAEAATAPDPAATADDAADTDGESALGRIRSLDRPDRWEVTVAGLAGLVAVAGSYATTGFAPDYVVAPLESTMSQVVPGVVITFAILVLGDLGQKVSLASATLLAALLFALVALAAIAAGDRVGYRAVSVPVGGVLAWVVATVVTGAPVPSLGAAGGVALALSTAELAAWADLGPPATTPSAEGRRRFLGSLATLLGVGSVAGLVAGDEIRAALRPDTDAGGQLGLTEEEAAEVDALLAEADAKSLDVDGIEPLVSEEFYNVSYSSVSPAVTAEDWTLSVTGAVENEVTVDYEQLRSMETRNEFVTLRCVGESLNGHKMDNALWTGTPAKAIVEAANPQGQFVVLRAADGYYEEFPLAALRTALFAYGMNGERLPRGHGYPVRALVPGHWGEINVKWVTEIEVHEEPLKGYWEKKGWHGTGPVNTVAKLHDVSRSDGRIRVSGHAYAGTRGVERVEVSTDGGSTWEEATLTERLPGRDVWRQWTHEYDAPGETHEVVVRAVESDGTVQPRERKDAFPSGATGWVSKTVEPSGPARQRSR